MGNRKRKSTSGGAFGRSGTARNDPSRDATSEENVPRRRVDRGRGSADHERLLTVSAREAARTGRDKGEVLESLLKEKSDGASFAEIFEKIDPDPDPHFLALAVLHPWDNEEGDAVLAPLVEKALAIDPECVDAHLHLARECSDLEELAGILEKALEAGRRKYRRMLEEGRTEEDLLDSPQTRPYREALHELIDMYRLSGRHADALALRDEWRALDPGDSRDLRPAFLEIAFAEEKWDEAEGLLDTLPSDRSSTALYGRAYLEFMRSLDESPDFELAMEDEDPFARLRGPRIEKARRHLKTAFENSPWVVPFLLDLRCGMLTRIEHYTEGDPYEALEFARVHFPAWSLVGVPSIWMVTEFAKFTPNAHLRRQLRRHHEDFLEVIELIGEIDDSSDEEEEEDENFAEFREISERIVEMLLDEGAPPKRGR